jgi:flagellar protein FliO/FliZ
VRSLAIDETRSLGNRQYLVVASYEGKKFLIGVCPGRIDMLSSLDGSSSKEKARE